MIGWKTRKILAMKEVTSKANLVKDHDTENAKQAIPPDELQRSRKKA